MAGMSIFSWFSYPLPIKERLFLIKNAGFDATSLWWGDEDDGSKNCQPEIARRMGLDIDYVHAPCNNPNSLWIDGFDGDDYFNLLISCIDDCNRHCIPTVIIHITRLSSKPAISQVGLDRIRRLVDFAEKKQINLALENMGSIQHLDYVYTNIQSDRLGFCYDSGHEYCNHPNADCLSRYGDKLFAVHLNDNFDDNDTHLLPFDGNIKWDVTINNLKKCRDIRFLTLEVDFNCEHEKSILYKSLSAADFLSLAHERLLRIESLTLK